MASTPATLTWWTALGESVGAAAWAAAPAAPVPEPGCLDAASQTTGAVPPALVSVPTSA